MAKTIYYRDWDELPAILNTEQAAIVCCRTPDCLRKWASKQQIPAIKLPDGGWIFDKQALREFLKTCSNTKQVS